MVNKVLKIITVCEPLKVITDAWCDQCHKKLTLAGDDDKHIEGYVSLSTYHHDWGNDSWESRDNYEFCSVKCCLEWIISNKEHLETNTREFEITCNGTYGL